MPLFDVFISHASEDKNLVARPLAQALQSQGYEVWYDEFTLSLGDKLRRSIDYGLANSRFGVVILSHSFFLKEWPQRELDGLVAREVESKLILPVWHEISHAEVAALSPMLADRLAVDTSDGIEVIVEKIVSVLEGLNTSVSDIESAESQILIEKRSKAPKGNLLYEKMSLKIVEYHKATLAGGPIAECQRLYGSDASEQFVEVKILASVNGLGFYETMEQALGGIMHPHWGYLAFADMGRIVTKQMYDQWVLEFYEKGGNRCLEVFGSHDDIEQFWLKLYNDTELPNRARMVRQ